MARSESRPVVNSAESTVDTDWRPYVLGPAQSHVRPVSVIASSGDVDGTDEFLARRGDVVLTYPEGGTPPALVLDYGREVAGIPWLEVESLSGTPSVRLSYSESRAWAGPEGDAHGSHNDSANRDRVEVLTARGPGRLSSGLVQGGQRYQRIALDTPGQLHISDTGFHFTAYAATADDYEGWFLSSSDELNRIWYESAYTVQINQLPADSLPVAWSVTDGALRAKGGTLAVLRSGATWDDLTVTFQAQLVERAIGWVVRAQDDGARGFLCTLRAADSPEENGTFELAYFDDHYESRPQDTVRRYTRIRSAPLETPLVPGDWHQVTTIVDGATIRVVLDDETIGSFDVADGGREVAAHAAGSFGFHHMWGTSHIPVEHARYRDLRVTDLTGVVLYENALADGAVLNDFVGDGVESPDPLPVILDGGKRDRTVWSGDLLVQIPNVFYTTGAEAYVRGSIELLNGYQEASGQSAARVPPLMPVTVAPQHGQTYSAVYSMHQILNVGLHFQHTGDVDFVRAQWPAVQRQLSYDCSLLDERGLIITDETNGLDWDWYDGTKTGAVSAYNITGYDTLVHASRLADAVGELDQADELRSRAENLRHAINTHLYDIDKHLYVLSDTRRDVWAQDANALAVTTGVVPDGHAQQLLQSLAATLPRTPFGFSPFSDSAGFRTDISPYVSSAHLSALFRAGLTDEALELIHDLWGHMSTAEDHAVGTAWELVATDGAPGFGATTSLAHGWASGAGVAMSTYVLGVRPVEPGFARWEIAPQPGDLAWTNGRVPTPYGPIDVSWTRSRDRFELTVDVPEGTAGTLVVPLVHGQSAVVHDAASDEIEQETMPPAATPTAATFHIPRGGRYIAVVD